MDMFTVVTFRPTGGGNTKFAFVRCEGRVWWQEGKQEAEEHCVLYTLNKREPTDEASNGWCLFSANGNLPPSTRVHLNGGLSIPSASASRCGAGHENSTLDSQLGRVICETSHCTRRSADRGTNNDLLTIKDATTTMPNKHGSD